MLPQRKNSVIKQAVNSCFWCIAILFFFLSSQAQTKGRTHLNINDNWSFVKDPSGKLSSGENGNFKWMKVQIPHTWNAIDVMDDVPGYYRGIGWYKKKLVLKPEWKNKRISVFFEGSNQETAVYLNGKLIGRHIGGYTGFTFPLIGLKLDGTDEIAVKVDNIHNENIAPLTADFTFFGGIYRSISLVVADPVHFEDQQYASKGVFVHSENVSNKSAQIFVDGNLVNSNAVNRKLNLITTINDASGKKIAQAKQLLDLTKNQSTHFKQPVINVEQPKLWSPANPYLYVATTRLVDPKTGNVIDEVKVNVGLRYFSFDVNKGFYLNGKPCKLVGASRHQDFAGLGNAVPKALQLKDIQMLKDMGGNFLRVAHYPQDQVILDACDSLGILASVEIPIVNEITESEAFTANCRHMQLEMIKQNYNHPSIIIWAYMNEVLLKMRYNNEPDKKLKYITSIEKLAQNLEDLTRSTDPTRYTMMSNHGDVNGYIKAGLTKIPMLVGWNLYQGWYGGKSEEFGPTLDRIHQQIPDKPLLVNEFGADVDPRIHAFEPVRFDKSLEYGMLYHQIYLKDILSRPFVAASAVWNLSDFSSETRDETMPHINNKGLMTLDRIPKNTYYLYKAHLQTKPFVKIGDGTWKLRGGMADANGQHSTQMLQVITNLDEIELLVNGKSLGKKEVIEKLTTWMVPFKDGTNEIKAVAFSKTQKLEDVASVSFQLNPSNHLISNQSFKQLNIIMGSQRQFIDDERKEVWLPSQIYQPGSWGSLGGEAYKIKNSGRQSYGSDKNIRGTANDPIYQTQLVGLDGYQLDVPKGKYELTLYFAELVGDNNQSVLPYNLDSLMATSKDIPAQRVFDVYLNNKLIVSKLNLAATYGVAKSVQKKFECIVIDDKGIKLLFNSVNGQAVLNALQVRKME